MVALKCFTLALLFVAVVSAVNVSKRNDTPSATGLEDETFPIEVNNNETSPEATTQANSTKDGSSKHSVIIDFLDWLRKKVEHAFDKSNRTEPTTEPSTAGTTVVTGHNTVVTEKSTETSETSTKVVVVTTEATGNSTATGSSTEAGNSTETTGNSTLTTEHVTGASKNSTDATTEKSKNQSHEESSKGSKLGTVAIWVGCGFVVIILAGVGFAIYKRQRRSDESPLMGRP